MGNETKNISNPLQLMGRYLGWLESVSAAGLFAVPSGHWTQSALVVAIITGLAVYLLTSAFLLIFLAIKHPHFLYNPSDYSDQVQERLFDSQKKLEASTEFTLTLPPNSINTSEKPVQQGDVVDG